ncbi:MAG: SDR family oxidoreductase [Isosphaeraceae bacterium]
MESGAILFTGGSGLLGGEIKQHLPQALFPTSSEFDVTNYEQMAAYLDGREVGVILHAAAFTSPPRCDQDPARALAVNIVGTANLVRLGLERGIRLAYISTDYVFDGERGQYKEDDPISPVNKYAWSKLGGECAVRMLDNSLIIRTSFGPNVFPFPKAFTDQWTSRVCVREAAEKIVALLKTGATGVVHVGGPRRSVYEYARSLDSDREIGELSTGSVAFRVPRDTSLDSSRFDRLIA